MYHGLTRSSPFPILIDDKLMREACTGKDEIRFMEQSNDTVVCSYLVSMEGTFDNPYTCEARGIVFDKTGKVIARPLHKFFNINEKEATKVENLDWTQVVRVMDKRDGSMIHTVKVIEGVNPLSEHARFAFKSKKSFESDVAVQATNWVMFSSNYRNYVDLCNYCVDNDKTAVFEWTSPVARIVLAYAEPMLTLLHVRDNMTGIYMMPTELHVLGVRFNVPVVQDTLTTQAFVFDDPVELIAELQSRASVEGWVIQFANGDMVKLKTKWYLERHRAMTFLRERDIALMVIREELDDLKALLVGEGASIDDILKIEAQVVKMLDAMIGIVELTYVDDKHLDRKEFALKHKDTHMYFGLLMQKYSGKEPDYKGHFEKRYLPTFSLRQLNLVQTTAEVE